MVSKGVAITFWGKNPEEPIITAGKLTYSDIKGRDYCGMHGSRGDGTSLIGLWM